MRKMLREIAERWLQLDPRPGGSGSDGTRGAPGFGSRSPASDHVITMLDPRSKSCEMACDGLLYERWQPDPEGWSRPLPRGVHGPVEPPGGYTTDREVWYGSDGRAYSEPNRPPRSVPHVLGALAGLVAEDRAMTPPTGRVPDVIRWLDGQLDHVTRQDWVTDVHDELRALVRQLKPVTGEPNRRHIGTCPNVIDEGDTTRECGARLYAPLRAGAICGDSIVCNHCGREWPRTEWLRLVDLLGVS
jgi:hypothetical protein